MYYKNDEIYKACRNKYPTDGFIFILIIKLHVYVSQKEELAACTDFFMNRFAKK